MGVNAFRSSVWQVEIRIYLCFWTRLCTGYVPSTVRTAAVCSRPTSLEGFLAWSPGNIFFNASLGTRFSSVNWDFFKWKVGYRSGFHTALRSHLWLYACICVLASGGHQLVLEPTLQSRMKPGIPPVSIVAISSHTLPHPSQIKQTWICGTQSWILHSHFVCWSAEWDSYLKQASGGGQLLKPVGWWAATEAG